MPNTPARPLPDQLCAFVRHVADPAKWPHLTRTDLDTHHATIVAAISTICCLARLRQEAAHRRQDVERSNSRRTHHQIRPIHGPVTGGRLPDSGG